MKASALIRTTSKKTDTDTRATVYFRLRDGKKDIKAACRNLSDQSVHYRPHNDLNDYLHSRRPLKKHKQLRGRKL